jgi:nitrogen-specific signal transduction histidine kinase
MENEMDVEDLITGKAYLAKAFEINEAATWVISTGYHLINFNLQFTTLMQQLFDITPEENMNILEMFPNGNTHKKWKDRYDAAFSGIDCEFEDEYEASQKKFHLNIKICPLYTNDGVRGCMIICKDLSEKRMMEENMLKHQLEHGKLQNELDKFIYSASHDLRSPILSIKGLLNLLKHEKVVNDTDPYLLMIEKSLQKLDDYISEIANYAYNQHSQTQADPINFNDIVQDAIETLKHLPETNDIAIITNIQCDGPFFSDRNRMQIIFNNIITNAIKYRDRNKQPFLKINVISNEQKAWIIFADNGTGIDEKYIEQVFQMFYRATEKSTGPGLGLYIVKETISRLRGKISLNSRLGSGTIVNIILPNLHKERKIENPSEYSLAG